MKNTRHARWGFVVAIAALLPASASMAQVVDMAVDDATIDEIIVDVLEVVDVDDVAVAVRAHLRERLRLAIESGLVREDDIIGFGYGAAESSATPSTERDRDRTQDELRERLRQQIERWSVISPEWLRAMEQVREQVRACLEDPSRECRDRIRSELTYRHAEQVQAMFQQRLSEAYGDEDLVRELEQQRERAQLRIETMLQSGDDEIMDKLGVQVEEMERLRARLDVQMQTQSTSSTSVGSSSTLEERRGRP